MSRVSIVLPTYNGARYLSEAIDSILSQTYQDWELIIVNDCSSDNTADVVNAYAQRDKRIKVITNEKNQKLPKSLNIGFRAAVGELLTWTSDDNYYLPSAIEKMVGFLDDNPECPMVVADMETIDSVGNIIGKFASYDDELMMYNDCVGACFAYRRCVYTAVGEYDSNWYLVEDYEYWLRVLYRYQHIGRIEEVLYRYRYHDNSLTGSRMDDIRKQLHKLRTLNLNNICQGLKNNSKLLTRVFIEMMRQGLKKEDAELFFEVYPNLRMIEKFEDNKEVAVFGAGNYGEVALKILKSKVVYFVDTAQNKIGREKSGIEIVSLENYLNQVNKPALVVAISDGNVSSVIDVLALKGVTSCSLIQMVDGWND